MKFDEIVQMLGEFGTYQKRIYFLLCLACLACGSQIMISVFTQGVPRHRCAIPGMINDTYAIQSNEHFAILNQSLPWDNDVGEEGDWSECQVRGNHDETGEEMLKECSSWVYEDTLYKSTIVKQFNLVCDKKMSRSHATMILMGGLLLGAFGTGIIADIVGRKYCLMAMVALNAGSSIGVAYADSFILYVFLRFLTGIAISGLFLSIFVLGMELVGPSKRMFVGIVVEVFWAIGVMILGGIAYFVRDWANLQMACSFPILLLLGLWWFIPESPRWLLARGRDAEAEDIIRHAAKVNGVKMPEKIFDTKTFDEAERQEKLSHAFTSPRFMFRLVILCYNWLVSAMVFYGLSLNAGNLAGNLFLNFQLLHVVEIFAYAMCLLLLNKIGRKKMHIACMVIGGGACLCTVFVQLYASESLQWINIVLALVGKCGAAAAFAIIYVYSAELFPTLLRNSLMGVTCLFARAGGMLSPYVADLNTFVDGQFGQALPLIVFGGSTVAGGLLCFFLPETLNTNLPETLEDATNFGRPPPQSPTRRRQGERILSEKTEFHVDSSCKEHEPLTASKLDMAPESVV